MSRRDHLAGRILFAVLTLASAMAAASDAGHLNAMGAHMHGGAHMVLSETRPASEADLRRAREIVSNLRAAIVRFRDVRAAEDAGYVPFLPTVPQEVYHFVNYAETSREYAGQFDAARPGALLYTKDGGGTYRLVGAMFSAPQCQVEELDGKIPLSVARWHAHVNVCLPHGIALRDLINGEIGAANPHLAGRVPVSGRGTPAVADALNRRYGFMADGRFGFEGSIATENECEEAGGHFIPQAWGWMVHVYPFAGDELATAFGLQVP